MSVLVIIFNQEHAAALTRWGIHFARGHGHDLEVIYARKHSNYEAARVIAEPAHHESEIIRTIHETAQGHLSNPIEEAKNKPEITIKQLSASDLLLPTLEEIESANPKIILLCKQRSARSGAEEVNIARSIFERSTRTTILMRLGASETSECKRILIPTAGGPHASSALKTAVGIADQQNGEVTALFVEPQGDEVAQEVGNHLLAKILRHSGVDQAEKLKPRVEVSNDVYGTIARVAEDGFDLVMVGTTEQSVIRKALFGTIPDRLIAGQRSTTIAVIKAPTPLITQFQDRIEHWMALTVPQLSREDRITLFESLQNNSRWNFDFLALIGLSTAIATLGLIQDSAAVVIGAMLVAPLMSPLLGCGLAIVQNNFPLFRISLKSILLGFLVALGIGTTLGLISPINELTDELRGRGGPTVLDMGVALLSGIAAAYCTGRPNLSAALPGVAIAAALVPPIATVGVSLALGQYGNTTGAALLFSTNVVAIILGASFAFYAGGVRAKKEQRKSVRWVRRTLLALSLASIMLLVPLSGLLYTQYLRPDPVQISPTLEAAMKKYVQQHLNADLMNINTERKKGRPMVILDIQSPTAPTPEQTTALATLASEFTGHDLELQLRTQLVIESKNPRIEPGMNAAD